MKKQVFNPYLPSYEYIPDGEPYVFGERLYVYGSHDHFNGKGFCLNDYVCWSASVDDLGNWRYEGVIYRKNQDPLNKNGSQDLYAPDVLRGTDGRYYLFYALNRSTVISVAVCDTPAGEFQFHGHVHFQDGHIWGTKPGETYNFDPGILTDDNGRIYLYSGFSPMGNFRVLLKMMKRDIDGSFCVELESDMLTIKSKPVMVAPGPLLAKGTGFEGHAFFEASSMRKINGRYYFIYSSELSHELCYATSDRPDGGFAFGGTLVSITDIGLNGNTTPRNYMGNTHGSIVEIKGKWYVFYHRQTNRHQFSRQGCAEQIEILPDGSIPQVEVTSCGLNGGPLAGTGEYEARIACNLSGKNGAWFIVITRLNKKHPYFTQSGADREENGDQYIANLRDGAWAGFKYFDFDHQSRITVEVRGNAKGALEVSTARGNNPVAHIEIKPSITWTRFRATLNVSKGKQALYFTYKGSGALDFNAFTVE
jgi:hypothetical protein